MYVVTIPCSFDNYSYLMVCEKSGQAAVIDPTEAHPVIAHIEKEGVQLTTILCTHHHNDHIGDIAPLQEKFPQLKVYCHLSDKNRIPRANSFVEDGDTLMVGEVAGKIIHTPGHTTGSICYSFEDALFVGDTLFGAGCGRLFEGTPEQMYASLNNKIAQYPHQTKIYFGHEYTKTNLNFSLSVEPQNSEIEKRLQSLKKNDGVSTPTTIELEKLTNPFLRCDSVDILTQLKEMGYTELNNSEQVFTIIRELRNSH